MNTIELFRIFGSVLLKDEASKELDKVEKKGEKTSSKLGKAFGVMGAGVAAVGGAFVAAGASGLAMANKFSQSADRVDKLSLRLGMSRQAFQEWDFILSQSGVSIDSMQSGMKNLSQRMNDAAQGTGKGAKLFEKLGLSVYDVNGEMKAQEVIFEETIKAMQGMENQVEKAALAQEMFGRSGQELLPLLNEKGGSIDALKDKANELGLVMGDDAVDAGVKFADTMDQLTRMFQGVFNSVVAQVLPSFQSFLDWVMGYMPQIQSVFKKVFDVIGFAMGVVIEWIGKLIDWLKDWYANNQETVEAIKEGFQNFVDAVVNLVEGFIALFKTIWERYGEDIKRSITNSLNLIKAVFQGAWDLLIDLFNVFAALFKGDWTALWESIKTLASNLWDNIKNIIDKAITQIVDTFKAINLFEIGKNIIQGLINGLSNMLGKVKEKAQEIANAVGDKVKGFFGIRSPSRLMMEYGENIGDGLAIGIEDSKHEVAKATEEMNTGVENNVTSGQGLLEKAISYVTNITVEGNIDSDLYEQIMKRQKNDYDVNLALSGVRL